MRRICLTLPTHRECSATIAALAAEAAYAVRVFPVEVAVLILDSTDESTFAQHAKTVDALPVHPGITVTHLDEAAQRDFLSRVVETAGVAEPELIAELMLPAQVSYGACTNRAFLIAAALGCESVHRRDSDVAYQIYDGAEVFPIHHELASLGRRATDAADQVSEVTLDPAYGDRQVVMVGGSFIGDMSVDIEDIRRLDPTAYQDIVGLWAAEGTSDDERRALVEESFVGAGQAPFAGDHSTLGLLDPMRLDMSNISYYRVHEEVPLPPMVETIGSDYFLIHVVPDSRLPGVLHNRHIINFHTPDRKAEPAFHAYHLRLAKFFLSMLYLHVVYQRMGEVGEDLTDEHHRVRADRIARIVRETTQLDRAPNVRRLEVLDRSYRRLGGRYADFADRLAQDHDQLLDEASRDMAEFATLIEAWAALVQASKTVGADQVWR
ncbi:DUF6271 family protein [Micromonosporaceae bacterium Da 78-11]